MKTKLTKEIELALTKKVLASKFRTKYGALEVPCGNWLGKGKENIDFATYTPSTQEITCYEIKVSKADFNSNASLSFYGNKNYLVAPYSLAKPIAVALQTHNHQVIDKWTHRKEMLYDSVGIIAYLPETLNEIKEFYRPVTLLTQAIQDYSKCQQSFIVLKPCRIKNIHLAQKASLTEGILRAGCRDASKYYLERNVHDNNI
ncbi:hypothetical protein AAA420_11415 [Lactobacillus crispatus]|uniref:hypothetical protein n=1 Tax=Lactobacillus crispatus TaxID=47770 RepID=UPI0030F667EC